VWQPPVVKTGAPYAEAVDAAKQADTVVLVLGLSSRLEGEEMNVREPGFLGGDRIDINLPHVSRVCLKPSRQPASQLWSFCCPAVR
jgi:beta-glucosidase